MQIASKDWSMCNQVESLVATEESTMMSMGKLATARLEIIV